MDPNQQPMTQFKLGGGGRGGDGPHFFHFSSISCISAVLAGASHPAQVLEYPGLMSFSPPSLHQPQTSVRGQEESKGLNGEEGPTGPGVGGRSSHSLKMLLDLF